MRVYCKSDIGLMRNSNQDYCKTGVFPDGSVWAVVCDGMGGANGGSTASSVAVETIGLDLAEGYQSEFGEEELHTLISQAIEHANKTVYETALNVASLYGMGTTVVCAVVKDGRAHILHAGDSRAYFYNGSDLMQITKDHSMVQELVDAGQLTREEARNHPNRNIITRALGTEPELRIDYNVIDFDEKSILVICTDGLSNYITEESLLGFIKNNSGPALTDKLIQSAKDLGGSDNITVAVIDGSAA